MKNKINELKEELKKFGKKINKLVSKGKNLISPELIEFTGDIPVLRNVFGNNKQGMMYAIYCNNLAVCNINYWEKEPTSYFEDCDWEDIKEGTAFRFSDEEDFVWEDTEKDRDIRYFDRKEGDKIYYSYFNKQGFQSWYITKGAFKYFQKVMKLEEE